MSRFQLLEDWRNFRLSIISLQPDEQVQKVFDYFKKFARSSTAVIDIDHPKEWLDPWQLIWHHNFCDLSLCYLSAVTLKLCGWDIDSFTIVLLNNIEDQALEHLLILNNKMILNYNVNLIELSDKSLTNGIVQAKISGLDMPFPS